MRKQLRHLLGHLLGRGESDSLALGGPGIEIGPRRLSIEGHYCQTLIVTGYPRQVLAGWAEPLVCYPGRVDVSLHIDPIPPMVVASRLRRRRARLESAWQLDALRGRVEDPQRATAVEDAAALAENLAIGQGRLYRVGLYITVYAPSEAMLEAEVERLGALAASMLVEVAPATFRALEGWISTLPLGTDALGMGRTMDTDALAAALPFTSPDLVADLGETTVVYGTNTHGGVVLWDRFSGDNYNSVILARSGAGKSYLAKLEILRSLLVGVEVSVIDPEDEYARLAEAVGGVRIPVGTSQGRLNPFELPDTEDPQEFTNRALFLHTLIGAMVGEMDATTAAALDRAILATYAAAGITSDPRTWRRTPPLLADLAAMLADEETEAARALAARLAPYISGTHKDLFNGPTTAPLQGHLVVASLRQLPEELKSVGVLMILDALWRRVSNPHQRRPRLIYVDEGWLLLHTPVGARYLATFAKRARKHWVGLTLITQDVDDVLGSELGRSVVANAATQILLTQALQHLDAVAESCHLSAGERHLVATATRGEALLVAGNQRVSFRALASPEEDALITTNPEFLARMESEETNSGEDAP